MSSLGDWKLPLAMQPKPKEYGFDLDRTLESIVGLRTTVPADAFTAETLGTERAGNGVLIRGDGLVLTIGYLITEAETLWLHLSDGRVVPGHVLAYDQATGFGLVQALTRLESPSASGRSRRASSRVRNSPAIGNTCWTKRSLRRRRTRSGEARR